ncbi:MAG: c-type cytochrome [Anaerolineae bacterium]
MIGHEQMVRLGEEGYTENCATCHRGDGRGIEGAYPALDGNAPVVEAKVAETMRIVQSGHEGMPRFGGQLTAKEIEAALLYIRNAWTNNADRLDGSEAPQE